MTSTSHFHSTGSLAYFSTTPTKSTTPKVSKPKDYSSAFAQLQSTYGTSGHTPTPVAKPEKQSRGTSKSSPKTIVFPPSSTSLSRDSLSSYGELPSLPHEGSEDKQCKSKKSFLKGFLGKA